MEEGRKEAGREMMKEGMSGTAWDEIDAAEAHTSARTSTSASTKHQAPSTSINYQKHQTS